MELWSHVPVEPLSYGRIAYWYGAKGAIDDHRRLQPSDLRVPELPR
jgi:homospermidine synthase